MNKIASRSAWPLLFSLFWNPLMTSGSAHLVMLIEQNHWQNKDNGKKKKKALSAPEYKLFRYMICLFFNGVVEFQRCEIAAWYIPAKQKVFSVLRSLIMGVHGLNPAFQRQVLVFSVPLPERSAR